MEFRRKSRPSKFRNHKTEYAGIHYDSGLEARLAADLDFRFKAGEFKEVLRQHKFELRVNEIKICSYMADFYVTDKDGKEFVYEAKGFMTPIAALKLKMFGACYPEIELVLVRK